MDVAWEFLANNEKDGWANATSEEQGIQMRVEYGELRGAIFKRNPLFDSPMMYIQTTKSVIDLCSRWKISTFLKYYAYWNADDLIQLTPQEPSFGHAHELYRSSS